MGSWFTSLSHSTHNALNKYNNLNVMNAYWPKHHYHSKSTSNSNTSKLFKLNGTRNVRHIHKHGGRRTRKRT